MLKGYGGIYKTQAVPYLKSELKKLGLTYINKDKNTLPLCKPRSCSNGTLCLDWFSFKGLLICVHSMSFLEKSNYREHVLRSVALIKLTPFRLLKTTFNKNTKSFLKIIYISFADDRCVGRDKGPFVKFYMENGETSALYTFNYKLSKFLYNNVWFRMNIIKHNLKKITNNRAKIIDVTNESRAIWFTCGNLHCWLPISNIKPTKNNIRKNIEKKIIKYKHNILVCEEKFVLDMSEWGYNLLPAKNFREKSTKRMYEIDKIDSYTKRVGFEINETVGHRPTHGRNAICRSKFGVDLNEYHQQKLYDALEKGIFLIFIWFDEYKKDPDRYLKTYVFPILHEARKLYDRDKDFNIKLLQEKFWHLITPFSGEFDETPLLI